METLRLSVLMVTPKRADLNIYIYKDCKTTSYLVPCLHEEIIQLFKWKKTNCSQTELGTCSLKYLTTSYTSTPSKQLCILAELSKQKRHSAWSLTPSMRIFPSCLAGVYIVFNCLFNASYHYVQVTKLSFICHLLLIMESGCQPLITQCPNSKTVVESQELLIWCYKHSSQKE